MKGILWLIGFLVIGFNSHAQEIVFTPQWVVQSQFAGFFVADSLGYYEEEGLDVCVTNSSIAENPLRQIEEGKSQIITLNLTHALTFNSDCTDENAKLVNLMQLSQKNSLMIVGRSPLKTANDIKEQSIGVWNYIDQKLLDLINLRSGLNLNWIKFNGGVNIFLSGAIDYVLVTKYNEYHLLEESGMIVNPDHILKVADHGYNIPEEGVYVTKAYYAKNKEALRKFVKASRRGWEWANEHREETVDLVMKFALKANIGTNRYHQRRMLDDILDSHLNPDNDKRTYHLNEAEYNNAVRFFSPIQKDKAMTYYEFVK